MLPNEKSNMCILPYKKVPLIESNIILQLTTIKKVQTLIYRFLYLVKDICISLTKTTIKPLIFIYSF